MSLDINNEISNNEVRPGTRVPAVRLCPESNPDIGMMIQVGTAVPCISVARISQERDPAVPGKFSGTKIYRRYYGLMRGTRCIQEYCDSTFHRSANRSSTRVVPTISCWSDWN